MIEKITNLEELQKKYKIVNGRRPKKHDLVYIPSQNIVCEVLYVEAMRVKIERSHKGSGLFMVLPPSQYKLIEKK